MAKMTDDSLRDFVRERDDALLSMNDRKLAAYMAKYRVHIPTSEAGKEHAGLHMKERWKEKKGEING